MKPDWRAFPEVLLEEPVVNVQDIGPSQWIVLVPACESALSVHEAFVTNTHKPNFSALSENMSSPA
jgi:hypothetical protein